MKFNTVHTILIDLNQEEISILNKAKDILQEIGKKIDSVSNGDFYTYDTEMDLFDNIYLYSTIIQNNVARR